MSKKTHTIPLTTNQTQAGVGDEAYTGDSGFRNVENWDFIHFDLTATGDSVDFTYAFQSKDSLNNVVDLHTGRITSAGNLIVELDPNPRAQVRSNITNHVAGSLTVVAAVGNYSYR